VSAENERLNHLLTLGRFAEAERYARECIGKTPDWGIAHTQLGRALAGLGRHPEAVEAAREGVRKSPRDAWALAILGYALKHAKQLADAAEALYDAARTDPTYTWTYCMLAEVELDRGRTNDAYQATLTGVRYDPNAENLLRWKAWCEYQLDLLPEAVATAESGLARHPNSPLLRNVLGCVRWHQAEQTYRPARKVRLHRLAGYYLTEAVRLNPSEDVYRNNLTRNARVCRRYVAERLLTLLVLIPLLALVAVVVAFGQVLASGVAVPVAIAVVFVVKLGMGDDLLRAAPLKWLGVPSPPLTVEDRRRGRRKLRWFAVGYAVWLAALVLAGLATAGVFGPMG
jgi:tetratricopeptide (TPR) repeat protein